VQIFHNVKLKASSPVSYLPRLLEFNDFVGPGRRISARLEALPKLRKAALAAKALYASPSSPPSLRSQPQTKQQAV
jgi:hypothetical protein